MKGARQAYAPQDGVLAVSLLARPVERVLASILGALGTKLCRAPKRQFHRITTSVGIQSKAFLP